MAAKQTLQVVKPSTAPTLTLERIQPYILTIRGTQVMLDRDLASLYGVETKRLNEQVRRNIQRFPEGFMFQLTTEELAAWRSQFATSNPEVGALMPNDIKMGVRHRPYAFTEHGITMLASVLKSPTAVRVSIQVVKAFVAMRHFITGNAQVFQRIDSIERHQLATDNKVEAILKQLSVMETPKQGVFYDGQLWDACSLLEKLIARAKTSIWLIDNWVDFGTLDMLAKKRKGVEVNLVTSQRGNHLAASDIAKFNEQYGKLAVKTSKLFHDRFLILDDKELYLIGASLKDLGRKCFGFTQMGAEVIPFIKARCV